MKMTHALWMAMMRRKYPKGAPAIFYSPGRRMQVTTPDVEGAFTEAHYKEACERRDRLGRSMRHYVPSEVGQLQRAMADELKPEIADALMVILKEYGIPSKAHVHVGMQLCVPPAMLHNASIDMHNDFLIDYNGSADEWAKANRKALLKPETLTITVTFPTHLPREEQDEGI